jgi:hypothetical protein
MLSKVCFTDVVPAPEEPVTDIIGCLMDIDEARCAFVQGLDVMAVL